MGWEAESESLARTRTPTINPRTNSFMKTHSLILGICLLPLGLGAQTVNETFNYTTGVITNKAVSGTGLTGNWAGSHTLGASFTGNAGGAVVNNWSYATPGNYAFTPSANQFSITGGSAYAPLTSSIATNVNGTYYMSFFLRLSAGGTAANTFFNVGLASTQTNNADTFNFGKSSSNANFGTQFSGSFDASTVAITAATNYFVVLKLDIVGGVAAANDTFSFNIYAANNDTILPTVAPTSWDYTRTGNLDPTKSFTALAFRTGTGQTMLVDEVRLGTSWSHVAAAIPEPSTFAALAGLGALGLAASRRRSRV